MWRCRFKYIRRRNLVESITKFSYTSYQRTTAGHLSAFFDDDGRTITAPCSQAATNLLCPRQPRHVLIFFGVLRGVRTTACVMRCDAMRPNTQHCQQLPAAHEPRFIFPHDRKTFFSFLGVATQNYSGIPLARVREIVRRPIQKLRHGRSPFSTNGGVCRYLRDGLPSRQTKSNWNIIWTD